MTHERLRQVEFKLHDVTQGPRLVRKRAASHDMLCAVFTALMWGAKTTPELMAEAGISKHTLYKVLRVLRYHGIVYRKENKGKSGNRFALHALNPTPFKYEDKAAERYHPKYHKPACLPTNQ